jgi:hypothetical protein
VSHLGLSNVIVTNICIWFKFILQKTFDSINQDESMMVEIGNQSANETIDARYSLIQRLISENITNAGLSSTKKYVNLYGCYEKGFIVDIIKRLKFFLLPCQVEYCIICITLFYVIWKNVGNTKHASTRHDSRRYSLAEVNTHIFYVDCNKAMKGLFLGILLALITIIVVIVFIVSGVDLNFSLNQLSKSSLKVLAIFLTEILELLLLISLIIATVWGIVSIRRLKINSHAGLSFGMDEMLELFALFGVYSFAIIRLIAFRHYAEKGVYSYLLLINGFCSMIQSILQTLFILEGMKKSCTTAADIKRKNAREQITFAITINLSLWLLYSLTRNKYATLLFKSTNTVGEAELNAAAARSISYSKALSEESLVEIIENPQAIKWIFINTISYPLLLYYHFHSSCCLSHMWKHCYKMH